MTARHESLLHESSLMSDQRRLISSALLLLAVGCQLVPAGSAMLTDPNQTRTAASATTKSTEKESPRALFGQRTKNERPVSEPDELTPEDTDELPWSTDPALNLVLEHEFIDLSADERQEWRNRLAGASPEKIARMLAQRRRQLKSAGLTDKTLQGDDHLLLASQRVSLAGQPTDIGEQRDSTTGSYVEATDVGSNADEVDWRRLRSRESNAVQSLIDEPDTVGAPPPRDSDPTTVAATSESTPRVQDVSVAQRIRSAAGVFDVFGAGGEGQAARAEIAAVGTIQPAGAGANVDLDGDTTSMQTDRSAPESLLSVSWQEDLDKLIALLEAQASQQSPGDNSISRDHYVRQQVALRMLYLIASRRPEAIQAIPEVSRDTQEFWTQMMWAISNTFDDESMPTGTARAAATVAQLREAVRQLESQASLQLLRPVFCERIDGFGDHVTFEEDVFDPGQPVLIYTEVRNFSSESTPENDYRTVLRSNIVIRKDAISGPVVFETDLPETEDRCQTRRQDYFHSYRLQLPAGLLPGPHVLMLSVTDTLTGKTGTTTLNFLVR